MAAPSGVVMWRRVSKATRPKQQHSPSRAGGRNMSTLVNVKEITLKHEKKQGSNPPAVMHGSVTSPSRKKGEQR